MQAPNETSAVRRAFDVLRKAANEKPYLDAEEREDLLSRMIAMLQKYEQQFVDAISDDFGGRVRLESLIADVMIPIDGARFARTHLREWMQRRPSSTHPLFIPSFAFVEPVPLGVVGVVAPWNYPVDLAIGPAIAALGAGNRVLIKPSELTPKTGALLARTVSEFFKPDEMVVIEGGIDIAREVTALPFDHLLFTGSTAVGRHVARAAAENLVPTTLELGGKSPALVHDSYSVSRAAERVALGKTFNAGQTCIAPDYMLVPKAKEAAFVDALKACIIKQHPNGEGYTSMASEKGRARMQALLDDATSKGAKVTETFKAKDGTRAFGPVIVTGVTDDMLLMQEEIFGPILPIETYERLEDAFVKVNGRPRPLAFYYFDNDDERVDVALKRVTSGGAVINDTLVHFAQEALPFGGVGPSGMGAYHGVRGFETFSHLRGVMHSSRASPAYNLLKPPFNALVTKTIEVLVRGVKGLVSSK